MRETGQQTTLHPSGLASGERSPRFRQGRNSAEWCDYFHANAQRLLTLPWELGVRLTAQEQEIVAHSMQTFQLGESGEGRHILKAAGRYAARTGDFDYPAALRLFIGEEHRHAATLGRILDAAGIPRIRREWSDGIFRKLRHLGGLELAICVLLTAELIAKIYYAALHAATGSPVIRRACEQILRDEAMHVQFQCERLALLRQSQPGWRRVISAVAQRLFFYGTCAVFWLSHRRMLAAGDFPLARVLRRARHEFRHASRSGFPA